MCNKAELPKDKQFFKGLQNGKILTLEGSRNQKISLSEGRTLCCQSSDNVRI